MKSVAIFEKVSFSQFTKDSGIDSEELYKFYEDLSKITKKFI